MYLFLDGSSDVGFGLKPVTEFKQGSVMDILGGAKKSPSSAVAFASQSGTKEQTATDSGTAQLPQPDLSTLFKKSGWTCDVCLVNNKEEVDKCVACMSPKPGPPAPKGESLNKNSLYTNFFKLLG